MRVPTLLAAALLVTTVQTVAADARDQFNQKDAVTIDPQKSYIFYRGRFPSPLRFMRETSPAEEVAWRAERAEALARAQAAYERQAARPRATTGACETRSCRGRGAQTVPPTEENFYFPPPEVDNFVLVAHGPQFSRDSEGVSYLIAVPPGTYVVYGVTITLPTGVLSVCQCMGSVRFDAPPGQIVDLGVIYYPRVDAGIRVNFIDAPAVRPYAPAMTRPARLNGLPVIAAELRAADKMPNYFGGIIDRHPAMPGILRYERDRVIDDRTGQAPTPRP
jgi:hypothetical protein